MEEKFRRGRREDFCDSRGIQHFFEYPRFSKSGRGDLEKSMMQGLRNPMREVGRITSGTKTISRPQSQGPMPRWGENRESSMPGSLPRREIIRFSLPPSPLPPPLSLSRSKLHLAASLSRRYYVYNALHGGISQKKKANRRGPRGVARPRGIRIVDGAWRGPVRLDDEAKTLSRNDRSAGCQLKRRELGNLLSFVLLQPGFPPRVSTLRNLELFQHARHLLVRFLFPTCSREKNPSSCETFAGSTKSLNKRVTSNILLLCFARIFGDILRRAVIAKSLNYSR